MTLPNPPGIRLDGQRHPRAQKPGALFFRVPLLHGPGRIVGAIGTSTGSAVAAGGTGVIPGRAS